MRVSRKAQLVESGPRVAALLIVAAASLVALQVSTAGSAQGALPAEIAAAIALLPAEPYLSDLALALSATSDAVRERTAALDAARSSLRGAVTGFTVAAEANPTLEFERDLADPADLGAWGTDIDLSVTGTYRRDTQAVTRARLAGATAEARLRSQLRDDLQRSLVALSNMRLARRGLEDAVVAAAEAEVALREAESADAAPAELLSLRVAAQLASNAVEREQTALAEAAEGAARLGLASAAPLASTMLTGAGSTLVDLAPTAIAGTGLMVPAPEQHVRAKTLALELALAVGQSNATAFTVLHQIEVYGAYENSGFEVDGRAALSAGVPVIGSTVSWTNGADDIGFVVGVGATLRLSDATGSEAAAAALAVTAAQAAYASFLDAQVLSELAARQAAELEFEDFALTRLQLMNVEAQLEQALEQPRATSATERELQRLVTAHRRAQDAGERAWQRYVRSLVSYLGVVDAMWRTDVMEER